MSGFQIATKLSQVQLPGPEWQQISSHYPNLVDALGFQQWDNPYSEGRLSDGLFFARAFGAALAVIFSLGIACVSYELLRCFDNEDARAYRVIAKYKRELNLDEQIARGFLGTLALVATLGLAWLAFDVRNLFNDNALKFIAVRDHKNHSNKWVNTQFENFFSWYPQKTVDEFRSFCNEGGHKLSLSYSCPEVLNIIAKLGNVQLMQFALDSARANSADQLENSYEESAVIAGMIKSRLQALAQWKNYAKRSKGLYCRYCDHAQRVYS